MSLRISSPRLLGLVGLLLLGGCCTPLPDDLRRPLGVSSHSGIDCDIGRFELPPNTAYAAKRVPPDQSPDTEKPAVLGGPVGPTQAAPTDPAGAVVAAGALQPPLEAPQPQKLQPIEKFLIVPPVIPGAATPPIVWPARPARPEQIEAAIKQYFPPLPSLPAVAPGAPGPDGHPLTLADLQKIAAEHSPLLKQAIADVDNARGNALQVGLPPNLIVGYEGDAANQNASAGIQGGYLQQTIKTWGKLRIAQEAAFYDIRIKEQSLRKAQADLQKQVRQYYFAYLWARENVQVANGVAQLTDNLYNVLLLSLRAGLSAPYEPMQLRVVALQTRGVVIQAQNRHVAAWQQLAAALSQPVMPMTQVAGQIDRPVPVYRYDDVLAQVFAQHSDILSARFLVLQAQKNLQLAKLQPYPDVDVRVMLQKDFTTPPFHGITSIVVGGPLPIWDRNQGNILQAQAQLARAHQEEQRVRNDLAGQLADAFERYHNNIRLLALYRSDVLPNQVNAFRGLTQKFVIAKNPAEENINYNDLVTTEQALVTAVQTYLGVLRDQWQATTDIANLLQTPDLFASGEEFPVAPIPALGQLGPCPPR